MKEESLEFIKGPTGGAVWKVNTNHTEAHVELESVAIMIKKIAKNQKRKLKKKNKQN